MFVWSLIDDDYEEEVKVLERERARARERGGLGEDREHCGESRMREVSGRVIVCWDLWGRVARVHREEGGGW